MSRQAAIQKHTNFSSLIDLLFMLIVVGRAILPYWSIHIHMQLNTKQNQLYKYINNKNARNYNYKR